MPQFYKDHHCINYKLEAAPRNRHVYLRIRNGQLVIRANPSVSHKDIERIIDNKWQWIQKSLLECQTIDDNPELKIGSECYFLGQRYALILRQGDKQKAVISDEGLIITGKHLAYENVIGLLNQFYKMQSQKICQQYLEKWVPRMKLHPQKISYRNNVSRWGSCSGQNNISFNTNLAQLEPAMIEYVVVHELAHIKEKNHSPRFWALVEKHLPNAQNTRQQLRQLEKQIRLYRR